MKYIKEWSEWHYHIGKRVRLISTSDQYTKLKMGDEGVISLVDDWGTVFVDWDNGSTLGLIPEEDRWELVNAPQ